MRTTPPMRPEQFLEYLVCPSCRASALARSGDALRCGSCAAEWPVHDHMVDFCADSSATAQERAYEGILGRLYGLYMDSPLMQNMDAWILGLKNRTYRDWFLRRSAARIEGMFLDVPIGGAPFLAEAACYRAHPWIGVDVSLTLLKALNLKCKRLGLENFILIRASVTSLPLKTATAHAAVSLFGFHCFPDKCTAAREISRVTAAGGPFLLSTLSTGHSRLADRYLRLFELEGSFAPGISPAQYKDLLTKAFTVEDELRLGAVLLTEAEAKRAL
jgi:ubiquinone/menaquinone biosynthesis C-methylase UbiE